MLCAINSGYQVVGVSAVGPQSCVAVDLIDEFSSVQSTAININYITISTIVPSMTLQHYFVKSAALCKYFGGSQNIQDCEILANLCVLQLYNPLAGACVQFQNIIDIRPPTSLVNSNAEWMKGMPWISYGMDIGSAPCFDRNISMRFNLQEKMMEYVVSKYSLNGTWLGNEDARELFHYCTNSAPDIHLTDTTWTIFGNSKVISMKCDLSSLMQRSFDEQYFYSLYLREPATHSMFAVPVRLVDYTDYNGAQRNPIYPRDLCSDSDVLHRRFFLHDTVSGIPSGAISTTPKVIRYASEMILATNIVKNNPERIYSPVLTIKYTEILTSTIEAPYIDGGSGAYVDKSTTYKFQSVYSMNTEKFYEELYVTYVVSACIFSLVVILRWYNMTLRDTRYFSFQAMQMALGETNYYWYYELMCLICHSYNVIFFPFSVLVCWYWFVFFKIQQDCAVMMPPMYDIYQSWQSESGEYEYTIYYWFGVTINMMFGFQFLYILDMIWRQGNADIFFLDWEPTAENKKSGKQVFNQYLICVYPLIVILFLVDFCLENNSGGK